MELAEELEQWEEYVEAFGERAYGLFDAPEYGLFRCSKCYEPPNPLDGWSVFEPQGEILGLIPQWDIEHCPDEHPACCGEQMTLVAKLKPVPVIEHVPAGDMPA